MCCNCLFTVIIIRMKLLLSSSTQSSSFIWRSNSTSAVSNSNQKVPRRSTVEWDIELGLESGSLNQEGNSQTQQVFDKKKVLIFPWFSLEVSHLSQILWRHGSLSLLKKLHTHHRNELTNAFAFIYFIYVSKIDYQSVSMECFFSLVYVFSIFFFLFHGFAVCLRHNSTFLEVHLFAFLLRVSWEGWGHSHIWMVNMFVHVIKRSIQSKYHSCVPLGA